MTKRLFAIVLAAVLAITMFTFPAFAAGETTGTALTYEPNSKSITAIWPSLGSDIIRYDLTLYRDGNKVTSATVTDMTKLSYVFSNITAGGNYEVEVEGRKTNSSNAQVAERTTLTGCSVPVTSSSGTGNKKLTVTSENGVLKATWEAQTNATKYKIDYSYKAADGKTRTNTVMDITGTGYTFSDLTYSNLLSVKVTAGNDTGYDSTNFTSWTNSGVPSSGTPSNVGLTSSGNITAQVVNGAIVGTINDTYYDYYRIGVATSTTNPQYTDLYIKSFSVPIYSNQNTYIIIEGRKSSSSWNEVGRASYVNTSGTGSSTSGNVSLTTGYDGVPILSWSPVTDAIKYIVYYQGNNISTGSQEVNASTTYWRVPFTSVTNTYTVAVAAVLSNGTQTTLGYRTVNNGSLNNYNPNYGQSSGNGIVTQGNNCTVTSYSTYAYLQWGSTGSSQYMVLVYREGDSNGSSIPAYGQTYVQIPISNSYGYNVVVVDITNGYRTIATASVKPYSSSSLNNNSNIKKTTIKDLKVNYLNSYTTSVSWDKVDNTAYYVVSYGLLNGGLSEDIPVYSGDTSTTVPFGRSTAYQVIVYAISNSGSRTRVGYLYNVPGTTADEVSDSSVKDYPSQLTAKSSNKKIKLTWKEAEDATSYTIYYKRATSSSWNKINQKITKTAVNISGLTNDIEYDFKVIPNKGSESGVVTIAPSTSSKTVTAKDPSSSSSNDGDINLDEDELTVTSVSSTSAGKIKITWSNVGAPSYKIYVAEGTSNSYKACGTYTGTSATISTFGTGSKATSFKSGKTYKVRIVRTDYTGSIKDALKACPYKTVTVK